MESLKELQCDWNTNQRKCITHLSLSLENYINKGNVNVHIIKGHENERISSTKVIITCKDYFE